MKVIVLALGFMAIFEGLMPLIAPATWQKSLRMLSELPADSVRRMAAGVIIVGLAVVWIVTEVL